LGCPVTIWSSLYRVCSSPGNAPDQVQCEINMMGSGLQI
jgi:hypothetical protein